MSELKSIIQVAQKSFREQLLHVEATGGMTLERYTRFLSMQFHLTNGVQRHFLRCASHPDMAHRKSLRKFLVNFADEEEMHFLIAEKDLANLDIKPLSCPLDVKLWWAYFNSVVDERPFVRLGATCILENISAGNGDVIKKILGAAKFLNPRNTRFIVIHQHEDLPHGDQILDALRVANLTPEHEADLLEGAKIGRTLYLRMFHWVISGDERL